MNKKISEIELLSPAGSFDALKYAVNNGADAVYLAGKMFGARAYANNFDNDEMIKAIKYAHSYGVKVFVTVNTLIYQREIDEVIKYLDFLYEAGADAFIIQDLGLASIVKKRYPDIDMHASTQVNCQSLEEARVLKKLGFKRIVLGREVPLDEIKRIKENLDIEIEVFVHGALCISYSGNCYLSSLLGNRSGNRGKCAQPCRLEYTFNNNKKYFLSTKDLFTLDNLGDIIPYVDSLKIEGRMKNPSYVGVVTNLIRSKINNLYGDKKESLASKLQDLKITFNREFTKGFILNDKNNSITNVVSQNHQGVFVGSIVNESNNNAVIRLSSKVELNIGDSIRIVHNKDGKYFEDAVIINDMYVNKKLVKKAYPNDLVSIRVHKKLSSGDKVYITKSLVVDTKYGNIERRVSITGKCYIKDNELIFIISDGINKVKKTNLVEPSSNNMKDRIKEQLQKINDTIFQYETLEVSDIFAYIKVKEINQMRRDALDELLTLRQDIKRRPIINDLIKLNDFNIAYENTKKYCIAVNSNEQLEAVLESGIVYDWLYIKDFKLYSKYKDSLKCRFYLPRVTKRKEYNSVSSSLNNVENSFISPYFNVVNSYTANALMRLGAKKIGLSIELSYGDICDIVNSYKENSMILPPFEMMIYGYYDAMIMKHCFINKALNKEKMPCGECKKGYKLTDRIGKEYPVLGDENCNITILYYKPVNLFSKVDELYDLGINSFLINFTIESKDEVMNILENFDADSRYLGHYNSKDL